MKAITNIAKTNNLVANKMAKGYWAIGNAVETVGFEFIGNNDKRKPRKLE